MRRDGHDRSRGMNVHQTGKLDLREDLEAQRRHWIAERIGWTIMAGVIVAAVFGLFGSGILSEASVGSPDGSLRLEYSRFTRYRSSTTVRIHVGSNTAKGGDVGVSVNRAYIEAVQVQEIIPTPEKAELPAGRLAYLFRIMDAGRPTVITFRLVPVQVGMLSAQIGLEHGPLLHFEQFVYP